MCFTVALNALTVLRHTFLSLAQFMNQYKMWLNMITVLSSENAEPYEWDAIQISPPPFCPNLNNFSRLKAREIIRIWTNRKWNYSLKQEWLWVAQWKTFYLSDFHSRKLRFQILLKGQPQKTNTGLITESTSKTGCSKLWNLTKPNNIESKMLLITG